MILMYPQPLVSQNNVLDADYANTKLTAAKAAKVSLADNYIYCNDKLDGERVNIDCEVMEELAHEVTCWTTRWSTRLVHGFQSW